MGLPSFKRGASSSIKDQAEVIERGSQGSNEATKVDYDHVSLSSDTPLHKGTYEAVNDESFYVPISKYEGKHRYDPKFQWEPHEEKKLVRKVRSSQTVQVSQASAHGEIQLDLKICSWVCLMFFALQLDRGNITQALADNMLKDLKLNTNDFNYGQTIFYVSFLAAELPSQLISKKLGPDRWVR